MDAPRFSPDRKRQHMKRWHLWSGIALATAATLALTGCVAGDTTSSTNVPTSTTEPDVLAAPTDASACVPDPQAVIDLKPSTASTGELPSELAAPLDAAASAAFEATGAPGAVVGVRSPEGTWIKAYGVADTATNEPLTPDVHHRVGSVTKSFTNTVIMQLASEKKLALSDPISEYVPNVPNGSDITILQLASMVSGIADYTHDAAFQKLHFGGPYNIVWTTDQMLATAYAMPPTAAPGAEFFYSNTNTILLGQVVENVTGNTLAAEMKERIFTPLGLSATSYPGDSAILPVPHAHGYTGIGFVDGAVTLHAPTVDATTRNMSASGASGAIISTVDDLLTYGRALATGQGLLSEAAQIERIPLRQAVCESVHNQ